VSHPASPTSPLAALRGLRSAPVLDGAGQAALRRELKAALAPCSWFTIGVMAPSAAVAIAALRSCEAALGWPPLRQQELAIEAPDDHDPSGADPAGAVFLKGNQHTGTYLLRPESGLGEGILISGHHDDPALGDTWGPLPLDLFAQVDA
jgi:hypothetical protein